MAGGVVGIDRQGLGEAGGDVEAEGAALTAGDGGAGGAGEGDGGVEGTEANPEAGGGAADVLGGEGLGGGNEDVEAEVEVPGGVSDDGVGVTAVWITDCP